MTRRDTATTGQSPTGEEPIRVVLVSGFLGAGKTTALRAVAETLAERGATVGMITNDQASGLVDTSILAETGGTVVEIPGGCFCCNFEDLVAAANEIRRRDVDLLLAEPVGSCTDLVATVINPLRSMYAEEFSVAPLTAMLDPRRVRSYLDGGDPDLPEEVRYIFRRQVEEADLVALSKADTLTDAEVSRLVAELEERVGDRPVFPVSARTGQGIEPWLSVLVDAEGASDVGDGDTGLDVAEPIGAEDRALTDIDYDTYADGEAKLGWVNATVDLAGPFDASAFRTALMERLQGPLAEAGIEVAHLKFSIAVEDSLCRGNLTATDADPCYGGADPGTVLEGRLVLNVRAVGDPETIRTIAHNAIDGAASRTGADATVTEEQAFRPEYPDPAYRMTDGPDATGSTPSD